MYVYINIILIYIFMYIFPIARTAEQKHKPVAVGMHPVAIGASAQTTKCFEAQLRQESNGNTLATQ